MPDYKTDTIIQESLRTELKRDVTVITVAHRLQTVLDSDKIVSGLFRTPAASKLRVFRRWSSMRARSSSSMRLPRS
jgi:hypothetical protein